MTNSWRKKNVEKMKWNDKINNMKKKENKHDFDSIIIYWIYTDMQTEW